ncbi:ABC transporter permease subunit [Carboxydochorda subterranea]|uniref:ABC transporter permease subunit n=1 Tax=Carboxydichorda subterranea TaxID=3109565 RepID=A0ABZ1C172_9FIRM|nr:ABC transporter permease subunit [Limnochorda sp. L945t]WRP18849.1 ABC transporter permease subunit [Limnochorda sp. L945t]
MAGLGRYLLQSVQSRDYPAVQGGLAFFTLIVVATSLATDVMTAWIDPRVRR